MEGLERTAPHLSSLEEVPFQREFLFLCEKENYKSGSVVK